MQRVFTPSLILLLCACLLASAGSAQYCAPAVTTGTLYISQVDFNYDPLMGGQTYNSGNDQYTQNVGSPSASIYRYSDIPFSISINNNSASTISYILQIYVDMNDDGDYDDPDELKADIGSWVDAGLTAVETQQLMLWFTTPPGNYRMRLLLNEGSSSPASACDPVTGEAEDYVLTVMPNTAPVLNNTGSPFANALKASQTNSGGATMYQVLSTAGLGTGIVDDPDDANISAEYRGVAITAQNAANGTWEYSWDASNWNSFGAVSGTNALLLPYYFSDPYGFYTGPYIRFVPTGTGTASFTFRAWDGSEGLEGDYYNITSTGGTSAFSTDEETVNITVYPDGSFTDLFTTSECGISGAYISRSSAVISEASFITQQQQGDIELDTANNKLYAVSYVGGEGGPAGVVSSYDLDGSNGTLITGFFSYVEDIAYGAPFIFYSTRAYTSVFRMLNDGSDLMEITNGPGQLDMSDASEQGQIEYSNGKLYFTFYSNNDNLYKIVQMDTTGLNPSVVHTSADRIIGLAASANTVYWTEFDNTNSVVKKKALPGGSVVTLATFNNSEIPDILPDRDNGYVYLLVPVEAAYMNVKKVPVNGGAVTLVAPMACENQHITFNNISVAPLPVRMLSYDAYLKENREVQLNWKTATETDNDHFVLEHATDGISYSAMANIMASNTGAASAYTYTDAKPVTGNNYYRLRQYDVDGSMHECGTRMVNIGNRDMDVHIYPNPVKNGFLVIDRGNYAAADPIGYTITDATGKTVLNGVMNTPALKLDVSLLQPGGYFLRLGNGQKMTFIKQ